MLAYLVNALLIVSAIAAPKAPTFNNIIRMEAMTGPFAGASNFYLSNIYDGSGSLGITHTKEYAAHVTHVKRGKTSDGAPIGDLVAQNLGFNGTAPNLVLVGHTLAGGMPSPVNQPAKVVGNSLTLENGRAPSESAVFSVDAQKRIGVYSTVKKDYVVFYGACIRFGTGQPKQGNAALPINEIQFYSRAEDCQGEYTYVTLTLQKR